MLQFDATTWGCIYLIGGVVVLLAGFSLLSGAVWARTVGVIVATISALAAFRMAPVGIRFGASAIIVIDVAVIWALTAHGRDVAAEM